ncbi:hypothetical protein G6F46_012227 [Rhizopus delemar]|uniref:Uncharacterized protein n=2 Tax=Rhizopus TaxID=4842 RepID=A0A9P7CIZ5_9FUNG|nr:hypothetical protein G6F55_011980 [Rhizopus delemar]KAG1533986.1 hypothetical protein G6F51_012340 [Rhizopus arrhizus]KAG1488404.1 hypothetical protein G6F54_012093 [Rhizopus delemar]KAG1496514.1 hypothetical protein G6F53_012161 [Rhizopus delemar]KAG1509457.1 hypothetical protein G6F52_011130 [Rhizopus delemar]
MNALVTSSIRIDQEVLPEVGSSTLQFVPSTNTRIYILLSQLYDAKKVYKLDTVKYLYPQDILSQLRQVRSKFIKNNGYLTLRASSPMASYHNLKPYTVWTVNNYDDKSTTLTAAKVGSNLFQLIARFDLNNKNIVKKK